MIVILIALIACCVIMVMISVAIYYFTLEEVVGSSSPKEVDEDDNDDDDNRNNIETSTVPFSSSSSSSSMSGGLRYAPISYDTMLGRGYSIEDGYLVVHPVNNVDECKKVCDTNDDCLAYYIKRGGDGLDYDQLCYTRSISPVADNTEPNEAVDIYYKI